MATRDCLDDPTITAMLGGRLPPADRDRATSHLDHCATCRALVAEASLVDATVDARGRARAPRPAPVPSVEAGRYRDRQEIARGGMGRVVEATDVLLGRRVAVKEALSDDAEVLRRFAREIRVTARLEHPSIVPVYDTGTAPDGAPFYVMRRVSGQPLEELVAAAETLEQRLALLPHIVAAANAVAHAHQRGVIHRDLKPTNILVGELGETVVIDWGLAKVLDDPDDDVVASPVAVLDAGDSLRTRVGTVFGTPGFMSPEQLGGTEIDERSDVYALGATLYHLLARRPPHASSSGTEMMGAAASGPPTPIRVLVPGVPRELSTIVDTALAYDPRVRYRDAGALAEELRRFLAGQLVAAHHYSPTERLRRFVRAHRVVVVSIAATLVVISIVTAISISRVLAARDRTDDALRIALDEKRVADDARARADDRADELTLTQARTLADTDPTAAVAMLKPLAGSPRHARQVRDIAGAARTAGVAWSFPAPLTLTAIEISPSGDVALASGTDGTVHLYDLVARRSRELVAAGPQLHATFAGEARVVTVRDAAITSLEIATGITHTRVAPGAVDSLVATATDVLWLDRDGVLWRADIALAAMHRVPGAAQSWQLRLSPDQRRLALLSRHGFQLIELATERVDDLGHGWSSDVAWDPAGHDVAVLQDGQVHDIHLDGAPVITRSFPTQIPMGVARCADQVFYGSLRPYGIMVSDARGSRMRAPVAAGQLLRVAREDVIVTSDTDSGDIVILSPDRDLHLHPPIKHLFQLATSPHGHRIVAAGAGRLFLWDLDELMPRRVDVPELMSFTVFGDNQVMVKGPGVWAWIDLATGRSSEVSVANPTAMVGIGTDPDRAIVLDDGRALLIQRGDPTPRLIDGPVAYALPLLGNKLLLVSPEGDVVIADLATPARDLIGSHRAEPFYIANLGKWVAVQYADGLIWRYDLVSKTATTLALATGRTAGSRVQLLADGRAFVADGADVVCWYVDGKRIHHAKLPRSVTTIVGVGDDTALAITEDDAAYRLDFTHPDEIASVLAPGSARVASVSGTTLGTVSDHGTLEVIDLLTGIRWSVSTRGLFDDAQISRDGSRIVYMMNQRRLGVWMIGLPGKLEDVPSWLAQLTNATADLGPTSLTWHD